MPYQYFKITKGPERVELLIPKVSGQTPEPYQLGYSYPMAVESELVINPYLNYPGEPLDAFKYQIKPNSNESWSEDIVYTINVTPQDGIPACTGKEFTVEAGQVENLTDLFPFDTSTDRIRIDSIEGRNLLKINGQPVEYGRTYMRYEFKDVTFFSQNSSEDMTSFLSKIHYTVGRLNQWGGSCTVTLLMSYLAEIHNFGPSEEDTNNTFWKRAIVKNGVPHTTMRVRIKASRKVTNFQVRYKTAPDTWIKETISSERYEYKDVYVGPSGSSIIVFTGSPVLQSDDELYLFMINCLIESSNGNPSLVHPVEGEVNIPVYNDAAQLANFGIINGVLMTSPSFVHDEGVDSYIAEIETPPSADVDVTADIVLYANIGTPPFTFSIIDEEGNGKTITQDDDIPSRFLIANLTGDGTGVKYTFLAHVKDSKHIESGYYFDVTIKEIAASVSVPVVSAPTSFSINEGQLILEQVVASNGPILNYYATGLPDGVLIDQDTGLIAGYTDEDGAHSVTITAENSFGISADHDITITVNPQVGTAPLLTSPIVNDWPLDQSNTYQITYSGTEPVTLQAFNMPGNWIFDPIQKKVYGILLNPIEDFTLKLTNEYGSKEVVITMRDPDFNPY